MTTYRRTVLIEWGDCDPAGIVFYPRYFFYFDANTAGLFDHVGLSKQQMTRRYGILGLPMVDTRGRFLVPTRFGDRVEIATRITRFGRSSFDVEHRLSHGDTLAVECWETRVWTARHPDDPDRLIGMPIPDEVKARFTEPVAI